jgi:ribosome-binding protein aMBF1 (putative translation factor)
MARKSAPRIGQDLAGLIGEAIASRGLTPTELGKLAGVDPTVIGRFVAGEREVRSGTLEKLLAALDLRVVEVARPRGRGRA